MNEHSERLQGLAGWFEADGFPETAKHLTAAADAIEVGSLEIESLRGECNVLAGILRDCQRVIETIVPENDEAEKLYDLRLAITYAVDPYKREGTLL